MNASGASPSRLDPHASAAVASVLEDVERRALTARVRFDTDVGDGEVDFVAGKIVDAYLGELLGRSALLGLLGVSEGRFRITEMPLDERPPLVESLAVLIEERDTRIARWRALSEKSPPLSSVLRSSTSGKEAVEKGLGSPIELKVLTLLDGRRTVTDVIDESELDAIDGLAVIVELIHRGLATAGTPQPSLFPLAPAVEAPRVLTALSVDAPRTADPPSESGIARRKRTVIGLGIATPIPPAGKKEPPVVTRGAEVQRIINVTTPPPPQGTTTGAPVPVAPRRRSRSGDHGPSSVPPSEATSGRTAPRYVGRYEVLGRIGYGGMGAVYLCRLTSGVGFRRLFALKILRRHLVEDESAARKFLEEAHLAGYMHHPNVVSVVDAGFDGPQPYLVMDYVEGASLKQLLTFDPGRRPPELILPILLDALSGLHAAHTLQTDDGTPLHIVHCDVSPENLLVGVDGICRLTDFGVAKHGIQGSGREQLALGKPSYMAPEQVLGGRLDPRTDIFAFGVMLYGAITGEKLFDGKTAEETMQRVVHGPIVPPSGVGLRPPPSLDFVCMKALERDPDRRFRTAEEMMVELRRIALRENLLAPTSLVANWVRQCVGPELAQRRLSVLDVTRGARAQATVESGAAQDHRTLEERIGSEPPAADPNSLSQTMALTPASKVRRWVTIVAAALAAGAVLVTLLAPGRVSRLFRVNTAPFVSKDADSARAPSSGPGGTATATPSLDSSAGRLVPPPGSR